MERNCDCSIPMHSLMLGYFLQFSDDVYICVFIALVSNMRVEHFNRSQDVISLHALPTVLTHNIVNSLGTTYSVNDALR